MIIIYIIIKRSNQGFRQTSVGYSSRTKQPIYGLLLHRQRAILCSQTHLSSFCADQTWTVMMFALVEQHNFEKNGQEMRKTQISCFLPCYGVYIRYYTLVLLVNKSIINKQNIATIWTIVECCFPSRYMLNDV